MISLAKRFWTKVDTPQDIDLCWEWRGYRYATGYGKFALTTWHFKRAHRAAYEFAYGPIPFGLCVLHRCDNRACCNPAHLFLGTQQDNNKDCVIKGRNRGAAGERNSHASLTREQVEQIRLKYESGGYTYRGLAREYGVDEGNIWHIIKGRSWIS